MTKNTIIYFFFQIPFHLEQNKWWEIVLNISPIRKRYNPCSENELWAHSGHSQCPLGYSQCPLGSGHNNTNGNVYHDISNNCIIEFSDQTEDRGGHPWRPCLENGQLPHFLYWPL